jgi:hypothetical protein
MRRIPPNAPQAGTSAAGSRQEPKVSDDPSNSVSDALVGDQRQPFDWHFACGGMRWALHGVDPPIIRVQRSSTFVNSG